MSLSDVDPVLAVVESLTGCRMFRDEKTAAVLQGAIDRDPQAAVSWLHYVAAFRAFDGFVGVVNFATFGKGRLSFATAFGAMGYFDGPY